MTDEAKRRARAAAELAKQKGRELNPAEIQRLYDEDRKKNAPKDLFASPLERRIVRRQVDPRRG